MRAIKYIVTFLNLHGFNLALAMVALTIGLSRSSEITAPLKFGISLLMVIGIAGALKKKIVGRWYLLAFVVFIGLYAIRLLVEAGDPDPHLLHSVPKLTLYMIGQCALPFFFYYLVVRREDYPTVFHAFFISGVILCVVFYVMYGALLGLGVERLGDWRTHKILEEGSTISPLVLSYTSVTTVVLAVHALTSATHTRATKVLYIGAIVTAMPAFLLGASRGPVIGFVLAFLVYLFLAQKGRAFRSWMVAAILVLVTFFIAREFESGVITRTTGILENNSENNLRWLIYRTTFQQFLQNPIFGGSLQNDTLHHFPHNIFLEALTATGFFGFVAIFYLSLAAFRKIINMFRVDDRSSWIGLIFIIYFVHAMFNGAIYLSVGYWTFLALLLRYEPPLETTLAPVPPQRREGRSRRSVRASYRRAGPAG